MSEHFDIIIVGGGPAGLTAAVYARRAGKSVLLLEKAGFGGQIATSPKVENCPGFSVISGASSRITHFSVFWQARHPTQKPIFRPERDRNSTSFPASFAPAANSFARISELLFLRRLVERTNTFFMLHTSYFPFLLIVLLSIAPCANYTD